MLHGAARAASHALEDRLRAPRTAASSAAEQSETVPTVCVLGFRTSSRTARGRHEPAQKGSASGAHACPDTWLMSQL